jgi:hypothetical protein
MPMLADAEHHEETEKMSITDRHVIYVECERLINKFLLRFEREHARAADLFAEDGQALTFKGREAIREAFDQFDQRDVEVNVLASSNTLIDIVDEDNATGACYATHYQYAHPDSKREGEPELKSPKSITRWTWEFKRIDGEWYISKLNTPETIMLRKDFLNYVAPEPESDSKK